MHRLHKANVRQHRLFMWSESVAHQRRGADGILDGVEQRQPGKDADGQLLLLSRQGLPVQNVVGQRHFLRQPEITGQPVPHFEVFIILDFIPVNGADAR